MQDVNQLDHFTMPIDKSNGYYQNIEIVDAYARNQIQKLISQVNALQGEIAELKNAKEGE